MSLNFDFTAMIKRVGQERYDEITTDPNNPKKWHPVTDRLIWKSLAVDLGEITEDNIEEWLFRLAFEQRMSDYADLEFGDGTRIWITREDLENHIGMTTNVTTKTRLNWVKRYAKQGEPARTNADGKSAHQAYADKLAESKAKQDA